jgi:Tfp pilus assembly protein FimT
MAPEPSSTRPPRRPPGGATAVELIILVMVVALLAVLAIPGISPVVQHHRLRGAAWQVAGDLRLARQRAVTLRRSVRICTESCAIPVATDGIAYSLERNDGTASAPHWVSESGADIRLPADVRLTANATPVFSTTGTASMACFTLTNPAGSRQVNVAMTGRVLVNDGACGP